MPPLDAWHIAAGLLGLAWITGNVGMTLGLVGLFRRADLFYLAMLALTVALIVNAGIVALFI